MRWIAVLRSFCLHLPKLRYQPEYPGVRGKAEAAV